MKKTDETSENEIVQELETVAAELLFPSETDAPLIPFFWSSDSEPGAVERLRDIASKASSGTTVDKLFRNTTKSEDWHNEEEKAQVEKFRQLVKTIKATLRDVQVFRVGETSIDVYIVGQVEGGYAGLQTKVVET